VPSAELERIAATVHHGGVEALVDRLVPASPSIQDIREWKRRGKPVLLLDRIGNPHNLGAIVRSAAFFGVRTLVLADSPEQATPSASAYRVAEGGMEHVDLYVVRSLAAFCRQLGREFSVVGTDVTRGKDIDLRTAVGQVERPAALVLGNEETGLAPDVAAACSRLIRIPGSGAVESLNVSAAAAVLLGWLAADRDFRVSSVAGR
jgi:TrmH RNA methyltransferase